MTTAKQQVIPSDRIWDMLNDKAKLVEAIATMRSTYKKEAAEIRAEAEEREEGLDRGHRACPEVQDHQAAEGHAAAPRGGGQKNLDEEAKRRAKESGVCPRTWSSEDLRGQAGGQRRSPSRPRTCRVHRSSAASSGVDSGCCCINMAHPFYTDLYAAPGSTVRTRAALEILLWTLGEAEVDAEPESDRRRFYEAERQQVWSPYLKDALTSPAARSRSPTTPTRTRAPPEGGKSVARSGTRPAPLLASGTTTEYPAGVRLLPGLTVLGQPTMSSHSKQFSHPSGCP